MANKQSAAEWLMKAYHDLSSARVLYAADHYTDTIASALQQALEKSLKSFWAYDNKPIKKTHNLIDVYELVTDRIQLKESQVRILAIATTYYIQDRYPSPVDLPPREQIKEVLDFAEVLFSRICQILDIEEQDVMK